MTNELKVTIQDVGADWERCKLEVGEKIQGRVLRLPELGAFCGNCLFLDLEDRIVALKATVKSGHSLLARSLVANSIQVGDAIEVSFPAWGETHDGERRYRHETCRRLDAEEVRRV